MECMDNILVVSIKPVKPIPTTALLMNSMDQIPFVSIALPAKMWSFLLSIRVDATPMSVEQVI